MSKRVTGNHQAFSVLVVGPAWVGDMVMAQSLFKAIKRQSSGASIDVLAPAWSAPLLSRMPEVRRVVVQPVGHGDFGLWRRLRLAASLRDEGYQRAIVIPRSFKAALIPFLAGIPIRTGYRGEFRYGLVNDMHGLNKQRLTQTVQRYVALAYPDSETEVPATPFPQLDVDEANRDSVLHRLGLSQALPVITLMPGAEYGVAKQWPLQHYASLAKRCIEQGLAVWVLGSEKDRRAGNAIAEIDPAIQNLCGQTRLQDALDLLSVASAVVCNDSGLMHVAAAVNRPVIALYGSSTPAYTPPLSNRATVLYKGLECSPCFKRECPFGHTHCLTLISVNEVTTALSALLKKYKNIEIV